MSVERPTRRLAAGLWIALLAMPALAQEGSPAIPLPADPALGFAEWLFAERDFYRAITEYERFLFLQPGSALAPWVRLRIGESYLAGGRTGAAREAFERLLHAGPEPALEHTALLAVARTFYLEDRLRQSADLLDGLLPGLTDPDLKGYALYLAACVALKQGEGARAKAAWLALPVGHPLAERALLLAGTVGRLDQLPHKSKALAGLLSMVPGLGHLYLGEPAIALTAFVWNGLFGFAAYDAFRRQSYGVGTLLAVLELLWYSGTIYGAVAGAERYNRDAQQNFLEALDRQAGLDIPFPDPRAAGLALRGSF